MKKEKNESKANSYTIFKFFKLPILSKVPVTLFEFKFLKIKMKKINQSNLSKINKRMQGNV
jgi:hypothetical protein